MIKRFTKFSLVGSIGILVNLAAFELFLALSKYVGGLIAPAFISNICLFFAIWASITFNFFGNSFLTWKDRGLWSGSRQARFKGYVGYVCAAWVSVLLQFLFTNLFRVVHYDQRLGLIVGILLGAFFNFFMGHHFIFSKRESS